MLPVPSFSLNRGSHHPAVCCYTFPSFILSPPHLPPAWPHTCQRSPSSLLVFRYPQTVLIAAVNRHLASLSIFSSFNLSSSFNPSSLFIIFFFFFFGVLLFPEFYLICLHHPSGCDMPTSPELHCFRKSAGRASIHPSLLLQPLLRSILHQQMNHEKFGGECGLGRVSQW